MREEILRFLYDTRSHYATYHNHKEASILAGIAFFFVLMGQLIVAISRGEFSSCLVKVILTFFIVALLKIMVLFLRTQFALRSEAANIVAACFHLTTEILSQPEITIELGDYSLPVSSDTNMQYKHVLPKRLLERSDQMSRLGQGARIKLERFLYGLVGVMSMAVIVVLWMWVKT